MQPKHHWRLPKPEVGPPRQCNRGWVQLDHLPPNTNQEQQASLESHCLTLEIFAWKPQNRNCHPLRTNEHENTCSLKQFADTLCTLRFLCKSVPAPVGLSSNGCDCDFGFTISYRNRPLGVVVHPGDREEVEVLKNSFWFHQPWKYTNRFFRTPDCLVGPNSR